MSKNVGILKQNAKIFISRSQNIFENLAFEEWLLRNHGPDNASESMLIWRYHFPIAVNYSLMKILNYKLSYKI